MSLVIRSARRADRPKIIEVVAGAFSENGRSPSDELDVVRSTWAYAEIHEVIELVASRRDDVVGHVLAAPGILQSGLRAVGVALLSVTPEHQNHGVGSALMRDLIEVARGAGWSLIVLLGAPEYCGRFGFEPASDFDIFYEPVGRDDPHFMALALDESATGSGGGPFTYCWE